MWAASTTGCISVSLGLCIGIGQRFIHSTAPCPFTTQSLIPTRRLPRRVRPRPCGPGHQTPPACLETMAGGLRLLTTPSSSSNLPMASKSSVDGIVPASLSLAALTKTITLIMRSLEWLRLCRRPTRASLVIERPTAVVSHRGVVDVTLRVGFVSALPAMLQGEHRPG